MVTEMWIYDIQPRVSWNENHFQFDTIAAMYYDI